MASHDFLDYKKLSNELLVSNHVRSLDHYGDHES
jgi:hypothetical protein